MKFAFFNLRSIVDFYFFKNDSFFSQHIMMENPRPEKENIIKDVKIFLD